MAQAVPEYNPKDLPIPQCTSVINYKDEKALFEDINKVVSELFLGGKETLDCKMTTIQGGITNLLYLAEVDEKIFKNMKSDDKNKNAQNLLTNKLLIRIYGENTEVLIDRPFETCLFHEVGQSGFGPRVSCL